jgi:putative thioredoxin
VAFKGGQAVDRFVGTRPEGEVRAFVARMAPRPGEDLGTQARNLVALGDWPRAAEVLRTILALNPSIDAARSKYVEALLRTGDPAMATVAFEPLRGRARADARLAALGTLVEAAGATAGFADEAVLRAGVAQAPGDPAARLRLAQWLLARMRWHDAMDACLELVRLDRSYADDAGRRGLLAAFELCDDAALVRDYRRRLSAGLH